MCEEIRGGAKDFINAYALRNRRNILPNSLERDFHGSGARFWGRSMGDRFEQLLVSKEVGKEIGHDQFNRNDTCTESRIIDFLD